MTFSNWDEVKLIDVCDLISRGITPSYSNESDVIVLNQKCIRDNHVNFSPARITNPQMKNIPPHKYLKNNDILVNSTGVGTLGRVAQIRNISRKTTVDSHITIVRPSNKVCAEFIGYSLFFQQEKIESLAEGSTGQTELSAIRLGKEITLLLPSLSEQKSIAKILSDLDEKINTNKQIIGVLEEMAQAILKNWFIDFEPFNVGGFIESEIGAIPTGWRVGTLKDIVEFKNGYSFKNSNYDNKGEFKIVTIKNVNDGELDNRKFERYSEIPNDLADHQIIQDQDILMTLTGNVGRVCLAYGENLLLNQRVAKLFCKVPKSWVYFYFRNPQVKETLINIARGSAQANLSLGDMYSVSCIIPDKLVLEQFNLITEPIINLIVAKFKLIQAFEEIRDSLLPKLMSGDIRVPIKEI